MHHLTTDNMVFSPLKPLCGYHSNTLEGKALEKGKNKATKEAKYETPDQNYASKGMLT
jgi:hypothetical protein